MFLSLSRGEAKATAENQNLNSLLERVGSRKFDMLVPTEEVQELRKEISGLKEKLSDAHAVNDKAGQLGLQLMRDNEQLKRDKENLKLQLEDVSNAHRMELEKSKKELLLLRAKHDLSDEHDQSADSARLNAERVTVLSAEVKTLQQRLAQQNGEGERLQGECQAYREQLAQLESGKRQMKGQLGDLQARENSLRDINRGLEEEVAILQQQIDGLKSVQTELDTVKTELNGLLDDKLALQTTAEEAQRLQNLAEKQGQEALRAMHIEREERLALEGELHELRANPVVAACRGNSLFGEVIDGRMKQEEELRAVYEQREKYREELCKTKRLLLESQAKEKSLGSSDKFSSQDKVRYGIMRDELARRQKEKNALQEQVQQLEITLRRLERKITENASAEGWFTREYMKDEHLKTKHRLEKRIRDLEMDVLRALGRDL